MANQDPFYESDQDYPNQGKPEYDSNQTGHNSSQDGSRENDIDPVYRPGENPEKTSPSNQSDGMDSVSRPPELDLDATHVLPISPGREQPKPGVVNKNNQTVNRLSPSNKEKKAKTQPLGKKRKPVKFFSLSLSPGCLVKSGVLALFILVLLWVIIASLTVAQYFSLTRSENFPDVYHLKNHASQFETAKIFDRNNNLLYEMIDPNAGRRTYIPLEKISPYLIAATIATEDKEYFYHSGFDAFAIGRALWQNYTTGEVVSGASTITQQLARAFLLSSTERNEKTVQRKAKEIVLAAEMTRIYSKEEILELYLNENNYGNLAYGIEAAAETYFHTTADKLTLEQSAFLAGLPQAPSVYDIKNNREGTLTRMKQVLILMYETSREKSCIDVKVSADKICVTAEDVLEAIDVIDQYHFEMPENKMAHPHWVNYIRSLLEDQYGSQTIYMSGFSVITTLDSNLQQKAEEVVKSQVQNLGALNVNGGALVAIKPGTGEILAMVGSPDFNNEEADGQINMAVSPRQPGSSIKPLTYLAAFEKGWTPATLIWDIPSEFPPSGDPTDPSPSYIPVNYDGKFHGPVRVREALANSYNIPAVKTLNFVGIYDNPDTPEQDGFIHFAERMGISTLTREDYGLSLTLGGGDVSLLELTSAYGIIANQGQKVSPVSILKIMNYQGDTIYEYTEPQKQQVIRPEHAYLMSSILSDNQARSPMFGVNSVLNLPFTAAAKTGTTNDFRDNWTIGYTPDLVVGVWVGNPDYTPMVNSTGLTGAAPIWSEFMQYAINHWGSVRTEDFIRPLGIIEKNICDVSGSEPSDSCPNQRTELFASDQPPLGKEDDFWRKVTVDTWTGDLASNDCGEFIKEEPVLNIADKDAQKWITGTQEGKDWAAGIGFKDDIIFPAGRACSITDPRPKIIFANISENQAFNQGPINVYGVAMATANFDRFKLEYGKGDDPDSWHTIVEDIKDPLSEPGLIASWNPEDVEEGNYTLRIYMNSRDGERYAEKRVHIHLALPTKTPTPAPTVTSTPFPAPTSTSTPTIAPETATMVPSATP